MASWAIAIELFCLVVAYFGLLWLAKKFFSGPYRAQITVASVLVAFSVGFGFSGPESPPAAAPSPAAPVPAATAALPAPRAAEPTNAGSACAAARISGSGGSGHLDTAKVHSGSAVYSAAGAVLLAGQSVALNGWAAASDLKGPASAACLAIDGKIVPGIKVLYGSSRPDVGTAYGNPSLIDTGFAITFPAAKVPAGPHTVAVASVAADHSSATLLPGGFNSWGLMRVAGKLVALGRTPRVSACEVASGLPDR